MVGPDDLKVLEPLLVPETFLNQALTGDGLFNVMEEGDGSQYEDDNIVQEDVIMELFGKAEMDVEEAYERMQQGEVR